MRYFCNGNGPWTEAEIFERLCTGELPPDASLREEGSDRAIPLTQSRLGGTLLPELNRWQYRMLSQIQINRWGFLIAFALLLISLLLLQTVRTLPINALSTWLAPRFLLGGGAAAALLACWYFVAMLFYRIWQMLPPERWRLSPFWRIAIWQIPVWRNLWNFKILVSPLKSLGPEVSAVTNLCYCACDLLGCYAAYVSLYLEFYRHWSFHDQLGLRLVALLFLPVATALWPLAVDLPARLAVKRLRESLNQSTRSLGNLPEADAALLRQLRFHSRHRLKRAWRWIAGILLVPALLALLAVYGYGTWQLNAGLNRFRQAVPFSLAEWQERYQTLPTVPAEELETIRRQQEDPAWQTAAAKLPYLLANASLTAEAVRNYETYGRLNAGELAELQHFLLGGEWSFATGQIADLVRTFERWNRFLLLRAGAGGNRQQWQELLDERWRLLDHLQANPTLENLLAGWELLNHTLPLLADDIRTHAFNGWTEEQLTDCLDRLTRSEQASRRLLAAALQQTGLQAQQTLPFSPYSPFAAGRKPAWGQAFHTLAELLQAAEQENWSQFRQPLLRRPREGLEPLGLSRFRLQETWLSARGWLQTARAAFAAELFRRQQGRLPATLEELSPDYLPEVPLDPADDRPLFYRSGSWQLPATDGTGSSSFSGYQVYSRLRQPYGNIIEFMAAVL